MADHIRLPGGRNIAVSKHPNGGWYCTIWIWQWTQSEINRWDRYDQWGRFETEDEARQHAEAFAERERALVPLIRSCLQQLLDQTQDSLALAGTKLPGIEAEAVVDALTRAVRALSALVVEARNG
jgi:hypothetical protein